MKTVHYYEIVIKTYHGEPVARLRFVDGDDVHETSLYSLAAINEMITLWKSDDILGSFAIGYKLAENATFQLMRE